MTKALHDTITAEFTGFEPPYLFAGGCKQSQTVNGYCVLLKPDGTVAKIIDKCREGCAKGHSFKYHAESMK